MRRSGEYSTGKREGVLNTCFYSPLYTHRRANVGISGCF